MVLNSDVRYIPHINRFFSHQINLNKTVLISSQNGALNIFSGTTLEPVSVKTMRLPKPSIKNWFSENVECNLVSVKTKISTLNEN